MSIEKELEKLGWDKDLIEAFLESKSELPNIEIEDSSSIHVYVETSEKTDRRVRSRRRVGGRIGGLDRHRPHYHEPGRIHHAGVS